jgi:Ca2+-binding RTX toxin-like protein
MATITGTAGADTLQGGAGDDQIFGMGGADVLSGGASANTFTIGFFDSPISAAAGNHPENLVHITDWSSLDKLVLSADAPGSATDTVSLTAPDFATALSQAETVFAGSATEKYVVVQVGADAIVFDSQDEAVVLSNTNAAAINPLNFVGVDLMRVTPPAMPFTPGIAVLQAGAGQTDVEGGSASDTITGWAGGDYLRGNDGDDSIVGGAGFDDINGNKGADTIDGGSGPGNDWLVGGQGGDSITAHTGQNLLYGNLGNDTLQGGAGADILRGGQGDDVLTAGSGNQFLSGDRGDDTVTAGSGNDTIHSSQDAGIDRILGFNPGHDVVQLDPGTQFTVAQVGADTVITMTGSPGTNEVILVGVQMTSLSTTSIFD